VARDAKTPRVGGLADTSLSSNKLLTDTDVLNHPGGESIVANVNDEYFVAQALVTNLADADLWFRYSDANNSYKVGIKAGTSVTVERYENGAKSQLGYARYSPSLYRPTLHALLLGAQENLLTRLAIQYRLELTYKQNSLVPFPSREHGIRLLFRDYAKAAIELVSLVVPYENHT